MKAHASYETTRLTKPAQEALTEQFNTQMLKPRDTGENAVLTMKFADEKAIIEDHLDHTIKRLKMQLKLLQTDLVPTPVRPRIDRIDELVNQLLEHYEHLLSAHMHEQEQYRERSAQAQLINEAAQSRE